MENQNKGYAKQERKDLMQDMPIVRDAMGGRSWMSKHSNSALNFNAPKHKHKHPKGDDRAYKGHTGNAPTSSNTSKKDLAKIGSKAAPQMGHDSPARKEGEKPKTTEQLAAASRKRGKQAAMEAKAKKDKKSGAHTGKMVTVMTSTGPKKVDSRSQAAKDLPIVS
jgi:hypothetical protein